MTLKINNQCARKLWLSAHGIAKAPTGPLDVMQIVRKLGFVQLDTIRVISRAHHHIIWSRNQNYREPMLNKLMADKRAVFEHYTHDASILPMEYYPMWQRQFERHKNQLDRSKYYASMPDEAGRELIKQRIANEGPLSTHAFETKRSAPKEMWSRPPHKQALDYMWYIGELSTSHRKNFAKFYDLSTRVIPDDLRTQSHTDKDQINWLCQSALDRLGIATLGEIQRFWGAVDAREVKTWAASAQLTPVSVQAADGSWSDAYGAHDIESRLLNIENPTTRLRILNPFDPVIRDRTRLERLFGFDYRIEIFVPAEKRKWGYYVFPLLEADKFIGRIEAKADRQSSVINVLNVWVELNVKWTRARVVKLDAELNRLARFVSISDVKWHCTHPSTSL